MNDYLIEGEGGMKYAVYGDIFNFFRLDTTDLSNKTVGELVRKT